MIDRCDFPNVFLYRISIWKDTKAKAANYPVAASEKIRYKPAYKISAKRGEIATISVTNEDTIVLGRKLQQKGLNPLLLNFADDLQPGGGVDRGAGAQEESLFRRTNLCLTLKRNLYPIRKNEAIYTPAATVFKAPETEEYDLLESPFSAAFIAAPGLKYPILQRDGTLKPEDANELKQRIHLICQVAHQKGHDALVLGAIGCGAWRSPPRQVAEIFKSVLQEWSPIVEDNGAAVLKTGVSRRSGVFKEIVFAYMVTEKRAGGETNYDIFRYAFSE